MNLIAQQLDQFGSHPVLIVDGEAIGVEQLKERANQLRKQLHERGWNHVGLISTRADHHLIALLACQSEGADLLLLRPGIRAQSVPLKTPLAALIDDDLQAHPTGEFSPSGKSRIHLTSSGTTGEPKVVTHSLDTLTRAIPTPLTPHPNERWLLTYQCASFAGLQVLLTALTRRASLICVAASDLGSRVRALQDQHPTHVSGTPSFWRLVLATSLPVKTRESLAQITLGGEAVDQPTLDRLGKGFPNARITHIYATTEAGVGFAISDGQAGFPSSLLHEGSQGRHLRIREGELEIATGLKSPATNSRAPESDDWQSTGDLVNQIGDRVFFVGRRDSIINVAGAKTHPEAVESVLLTHPAINDIRVYARTSPVVGSVVAADIVLNTPIEVSHDELKEDLHHFAAERLAIHQIPRMVRFVDQIETEITGKKKRHP